MKAEKLKQFRIIESASAEEFQTELNKALTELVGCDPVVDADVKAGFKAFISYTIKKDVPETIEEQFLLNGISYQCSQCPNCKRFTKTDGTVDNRKKKAMCTEFGTCFTDGAACEWFYEQLADGKIEVVE